MSDGERFTPGMVVRTSMRIAEAPLHQLVLLIVYGVQSRMADAALEDIGIDSDLYYARKMHKCVEVEVVHRLSMMNRDEDLFHITVHHMLIRAREAERLVDTNNSNQLINRVFLVLFKISDLLPPRCLNMFARILDLRVRSVRWLYQDDDQNRDLDALKFDEEFFAMHVQMFKKHPNTFADLEQHMYVHTATELWMRFEEATYATYILGCMMKSRHALTETSRRCLLDALSDEYVDRIVWHTRSYAHADSVEWGDHEEEVEASIDEFRETVDRCRRLLSVGSLAWLRIRFRVSVMATLTKMLRESAERVNAPGGSGYEQAMKRFKGGPEAYADVL